MREYLKFYIDGKWVDPTTPKTLDVINPSTEEPIGQISLGSKADIDKAVKAGAKLMMPVFDVPNVGRIAMLLEPGGAGIGWMTPVGPQTNKG